jgi:hypothetical protein
MLQTDAAGEVEAMASEEKPAWIGRGPRSSKMWLSWAFSLSGSELEAVQQALDEGRLPITAEFIGVGRPEWAAPPPEGSGPLTTAAMALDATVRDLPITPSTSAERDGGASATAKPKMTPQPSSVPADAAPEGRELLATSGAAVPPQENGTPRPKATRNAETMTKRADADFALPSPPPSAPQEPAVSPPALRAKELAGIPPPAEVELPTARVPSEASATPEWDDADAATIARRALDAQTSAARLDHIAHLVWQWLADGEPGLALHLVQSLASEPLAAGMPPQWLIEMTFLKGWLSAEQYAVCLRVRELTQRHADHPLPDIAAPNLKLAWRLLAASALMRPALLSPSNDIATTLRHVCSGEDTPFWRVAARLALFAGENIALSPDIIQGSLSQAEWDSRAQQLRSEVDLWSKMVKESKLNYAPATHVQAAWMKTGGLFSEILSSIGNDATLSAKSLRVRLDRMDIDSEIDRTQSLVLRRHSRIDGQARKALWRRADELLTFARQWLDLLDARKSDYHSSARSQLLQLRQTMDSSKTTVEQEFAALAEKENLQALVVCIAARLALQEFRHLSGILRGEHWPKTEAVPLDHIKSRDLLRLPGWMDADDSTTAGQDRASLLLRRTADGRLSYAAAFEELCERGRHDSTSALLDCLRGTGASAEEVARLESRRSSSIGDWRNRILCDLGDAERRLNDAVGKGLMPASDFGAHQNTVQRHKAALGDVIQDADINFETIRRDIDAINASVATTREQEICGVRTRLEQAAISDQASVARIEQIIASGDVILANDYMERVARGDILPPSADLQAQAHFLSFFGDGRANGGTYDAIHELLSAKPFPAAELVRKVREGQGVAELGPLQAQCGAAPDYADALQAWFEIEQMRRVRGGDAQVAVILRGLGFPLRGGLSTESGTPFLRFGMECKVPVPSPIPQFGSETRGRYAVLCVPQFRGVENMFSQIAIPQGDTRGLLALVFDKLSRKDRAELGQACQKYSRNVLVLDDILMVHLIAAGSQRLSIALACAMPFTNAMPYNFTANPLPREMFYGRRREIEAVISGSSSGSCFVYGGRQIGKTVLLTEVQRRFHIPSDGHVARHIDLKAKQIGTQRRPFEIWTLLAEELRACVPELIGDREKFPKKITYDWFAGRVKEWLNKNLDRRILLLLDEADAFLESDGNSAPTFAECDNLRLLMKETELRFKAVLAGLHNVQRATRVANQPLVYFGEPLCIGPLISNGEARQAYKLISEPLASLGVYFENQDLPNSILARTNYYPNLIQIYCQNLLIHIRDRWTRIGASRGAPYYVTAADLDEVYERQELRQELRAKFKLSLDLDRRFRLIANILAYNLDEHPQGMEASAIRTQVMDWWPKGFCEGGADSRPLPYDIFRQLLNEMAGLGILSLSKDEVRFSLRSPNVLVLLGTREEIERDICASSEWELAPVYTPSTFHGQITSAEPCKRSPLTAEQEAQIAEAACTVHVVLGCRAAGLDALPEALRFRYGDVFFPVSEKTESQFIDFLSSSSRQRGLGKTLLFVPPTLGWSCSWVAKTRQYLDRLSRENAHIGVVFGCDPARLWQLRSFWREIEASVRAVQALHPWHDDALRNWLADSPFGEQPYEVRKSIRNVTGNWHELLMRMRERHKKGITLAGILDTMATAGGELAVGSSFVEAFGIVDGAPRKLLDFIAKNPKATTEDISVFADEGPLLSNPAVVRDAIWWAERLDFIYASEGGWKVDGALARLLDFAGEDGHGA